MGQRCIELSWGTAAAAAVDRMAKRERRIEKERKRKDTGNGSTGVMR